MSLGYRVFFVHNEDVHRISQKRFESLYQNNTEPLPIFADQTIISVLVAYEVVERKPDCVIRIDTQKIRFDTRGFVDRAYEYEGLQLVASRMDDVLGSVLNSCNGSEISNHDLKDHGTIIAASKRFDERRWNQRHPELSEPLLKEIMDGVFGV